MLTLQCCPGAKDEVGVQVPPAAIEKSPFTLSEFRIRGVVPEFVTVTLFAALVVFTRCDGNVSTKVFNEARGLITVAVSETVCGLPAAVSVIVRFAEAEGSPRSSRSGR